MAQIYYGHDTHPVQLSKRLIGKRPILPSIAKPGAVQGWTVAQEAYAQILNALKVVTPPRVVAARL